MRALRPEPTREDVLKKILPSAVQIVVEQHEGRRVKSGSGGEGRRVRALLVASRDDDVTDLALLRAEVDDCAARPAPTPALGKPIWVVGFPLGRHIMLSSGVSQIAIDGASNPGGAARLIVDASQLRREWRRSVRHAHWRPHRRGRRLQHRARDDRGMTPPWYIDVPVPGQMLVTPISGDFSMRWSKGGLLPP